VTAAEEGLKGKPEPDTFLAAARKLGVEPARAAVFEDATAGFAAGRAGKFGYVVGVDRIDHDAEHDHADALRDHGADVVVNDLSALLREDSE
jgi:beta-phosphoglucomutase-like phosphatase (HAD superfamily)